MSFLNKLSSFRLSLVEIAGLVALLCGLAVITAPTKAGAGSADLADCTTTRGPSALLPEAKLLIEHNSTDEDTGVHGLFDGVDWTSLEVFDPNGQQILNVEPKNQFRTEGISGIFFEGAEPPNAEVPIEEILRRFPEGRYTVRGCSTDGRRLRGAALFTHDIPAGPIITFPQDGGVAPSSGFAVTWNHVTTTIDGKPITRTGYEVIITKDVPDDPNGFSRPTYDVHVGPSETSLTVPSEFLEPGTRYELEVLALEVSGNQTLTGLFFQTN